jgi:hypothetical protein
MRLMLGLALLLAGVAQAATLDLGNVAPGSGGVRLAFADGTSSSSLSYLQFVRVDRPRGRVDVVAIGAADRVLAEAAFEFEPGPDVDAMLVLIGNGSPETPYELRLYDGVGSSSADNKATIRATVGLHHLAPFAGATTVDDFEAVAPCEQAGNISASSASRVSRYGQNSTQSHVGEGGFTCSLKTAHPGFGSFDLPTSLVDGTLRFLLVGDGQYEPQRVLILQNGAVQRVASETAPAVGAVMRSPAFWFDLARPAQGVSLYELKDSDDVFGTWFTHDAAGKPIWYLFDGVATGVPGQRELMVYSPARNGRTARLGAVGTARLFYVDCNQAELRVLLGDGGYFTLRLRRSREVIGCDALD